MTNRRRHERTDTIEASTDLTVRDLLAVKVSIAGAGHRATRPIGRLITMITALLPTGMCLIVCVVADVDGPLTLLGCTVAGAATAAGLWLITRRRPGATGHDDRR